ncbi:hypothetical protein [Sphaerisporangium sp. NPDC051011]|uniref:hypothetical protein n=1 Tax=Sphaerisporangium sp. NPDC051011 TaxID=3155792 RepID=UPI0033F37686
MTTTATGPEVAAKARTDAEAARRDVVRALKRRFTGWTPWYGDATGHWWALPPAHHRDPLRLIEAAGPDALAERMWQADAHERRPGPASGAAQHVRPRRPIPRSALRPRPHPSL